MEATALCSTLMMLGFTLTNSYKSDAVSLHVTPNRLQHFQLDTVSFRCVGSDGLSKLKVSRNAEEKKPECDSETPTGSSCTIDRIYPSDSGEYWCETGGGERSSRANISVTDGAVILESPVLPVSEGETVTLSCRTKNNLTSFPAGFSKDGRLLPQSGSAEMTLTNVSQADRGLYSCCIDGVGVSAESRLAVRGPRSDGHDSPKVLFLLWIAVSVFLLAVVLLLVGFLHLRNHRASSKTPASHSGPVCVEDAEDDPDGVTYAVVVAKPRKDKDCADDNKSSESQQSSKPQSAEDESSLQPVYSALTISEALQAARIGAGPGPSSPTEPLNPTAATDSSPAEQEVLYAPVHKAKKSEDC